VPLGIATDYTYRDFFADVVDNGQLMSFYDFENRASIFPGVHRNYNFALTTLVGADLPQSEAEFAFFMTQFDHLQDEERRFTLSGGDLALINPNTHTVPIFRTRRDAELTRKLHRAAPVLVDEITGKNPWGVAYRQGLFHSANDSYLFIPREQLVAKAHKLRAYRFVGSDHEYLPLYEGKMLHQFDHRHGTYEGQTPEKLRKGLCREGVESDKRNANFLGIPRYWVLIREVENRIPDRWSHRWLLAFRDVTRAVDKRTAQFAILPRVGVCDQAALLFVLGKLRVRFVTCLLANMNSFALDFVARQKVGGIHLKKFTVYQLPTFPPDRYTPDLLDFIVPRVVELTYTAWDLQPFAQDILGEVGPETWARWFADAPVHTSPPPAWAPGTSPPPFVWDEERRAHLRAELDGLYAHLYGLTREELDYILDTFPIVRRKDEERWGEYRTKRMVLEAYEEHGLLG